MLDIYEVIKKSSPWGSDVAMQQLSNATRCAIWK